MENNNKETNVLAIVGFILSFFIGIAGLVCSIIGLKKSKELNDGKGFSIAGIIISSLRIALTIFAFILGMLIVVEESKDVIDNTKDNIKEIMEENNNKGYIKSNTIEIFANNKNNIITFEYIIEPYIYENPIDEGFKNITYVKVKINDNYVEDYEIPYTYNKSQVYDINYLYKDNVQILKGEDKDYFVLLITEADLHGDGRVNPTVVNEKGKKIYEIDYLANSTMFITDENSIMYNKGMYYVDNDKLFFIKPAEVSNNPDSKEPGQDDTLYQEYILTVSNDKAKVEEWNTTYGSGAGAI